MACFSATKQSREPLADILGKTQKDESMTTINDFKHFDPLKNNGNEIPDEKGVYLILLRKGSKLPKTDVDYTCQKVFENEVVYVGISNRSLRKRDFRQHFNGNAGSSTLRKSIGSLFKFKKISRSLNQDDGKTKFNEKDEQFISNWMKSNLEFYYLVCNNTNAIEEYLIEKLNPPLNISKNYNQENLDFRKSLSTLRSIK